MNVAVFLLVIVAFVMGFFKIQFITDNEARPGVDMFKFFTVQSNILAGIACAVLAVYEILYSHGRINAIPEWVYLFKYVSTIGVTLTMLTVVCFLGFIAPGGYFSLFINSNLFFHFVIPMITLISFVLFEHTEELKFFETTTGLFHSFFYGIFYMVNAYSHMEGGAIPAEHNWYGFAYPNVLFSVIMCVVMLAVTYGISVAIWALNRKVNIIKED